MTKLKLSTVTAKLNKKAKANIGLISAGDVAAVSFSIKYDPAVLSLHSIVLVDAPEGTVASENSNTQGQLGVLIDGITPFAKSGSYKTIATVIFNAIKTGKTNLEFTETPVRRNAANTKGALLKTTYSNGKVTVT